jgi:hypothetical protein
MLRNFTIKKQFTSEENIYFLWVFDQFKNFLNEKKKHGRLFQLRI